ncbi:MAG: type I methionyl aminopeptidase [Deltaproteobacteria bacterium]
MAIELHNTEDARRRLRAAGRAAASTLYAAGAAVRPGLTTAQIDTLVRRDTAARGGRPTQLGYHGFPAAVCTSVNHVVCHGIPSPDVVLEDGDIINIDCTTELDGYCGDTSTMFFVGTPSPDAEHVVRVAKEALMIGIAQVRPGARLGDIGAAIQAFVEREGCSVVREYGGHGIGRTMHEAPHVPHHGKAGRGLRLREGMVFTIEPMVNLGGADVRVLGDDWTVVTDDGSLSAQAEHTVYVGPEGAEILTLNNP